MGRRTKSGVGRCKLQGTGQVPIGMAIATLIDIIAKATERETAKEAMASEAATAWIRRAEATGAKRPPNHPLEPGERLIVESPQA